MAFYSQSSSGSSSPGSLPPVNGANQRLLLDNMLRRELRVSDPSDPNQIAQALLSRYKDTPRAQAINQEAKGLPFLQSGQIAPMVSMVATASEAELEQAKSDVERDLAELTTSSLLKDVIPELQGWAQAVRSAIQEGTTAARFGLDPRQRDKSFAIRRQLGDYARMARLVGALTPAMNFQYRAFAQSLDEVSAIILVRMGEALANVGFAGGRFLLQTPYAELQVRRDAVIYTLRNLIGATQDAYAPNEWPRGLDAYRRLFDALEVQGQGDLRTLLTEAELTRSMDELIQRAAHGSVDGLRALGSTAQLDLQRFYRIIAVASRSIGRPESPPLIAFLEAIRLFADAFNPAGGFRLLRIARPAILFYGLYGSDEIEPADRRLTQLTIRRGILAGQLDCLMRCNCTPETVLTQIVLDKILCDVDRAIDLYALGDDDLGQPEIRAAAYAYMIDAANGLNSPNGPLNITADIRTTIIILRNLLRPIAGTSELSDWRTTPNDFDDAPAKNNLIEQELCIQREGELRWEELVTTMAPNCIPVASLLGKDGILLQLTGNAINSVLGNAAGTAIECDPFTPDIPEHYETSLAGFVFHRGAAGENKGFEPPAVIAE